MDQRRADHDPGEPAAPPRRRSSKRRSPAQSRDRILKAANSEFALHGFAGARIDRIVKKADSNPRMVYHYFGSKSELYVAVLESALGDLRAQELRIDVEDLDPLEGLLQLFDFVNNHFEANPHLARLLSNENMLKARYMRNSARIREMSSPVLAMIARLLKKGAESGVVGPDIDPLRVYVVMVALGQFHVSNVHTLSVIFEVDLEDPDWRAKRHADVRRMLGAYLGSH
jgi:AcrR family transcriptional regulator